MALLLKNGGVWKGLAAPSVRRNGLWSTPQEIWTRDTGSWSKVWPTVNSISYTGVGAAGAKNSVAFKLWYPGPVTSPAYLAPFTITSATGFRVAFDSGGVGTQGGLYAAYLSFSQLRNDQGVYTDPNFRINKPFVDPNTAITLFNNTKGEFAEQWTAADSKKEPFNSNSAHTFYPQNTAAPVVAWDTTFSIGDTITATVTGNF